MCARGFTISTHTIMPEGKYWFPFYMRKTVSYSVSVRPDFAATLLPISILTESVHLVLIYEMGIITVVLFYYNIIVIIIFVVMIL